MASEILTIRVPKELKEKMRKLNINWSEEIRLFIERKIRSHELLQALTEIRCKAKERRVSVDSVKLIREDREMR